jgi:hypothetical protein
MRRLTEAVADGWPAIAAFALAAVLAHSGVGHLTADAALREHYRAALGSAAVTPWVGLLQIVAAVALCLRRTRGRAAVAVLAVVGAALAYRVARTGTADPLAPALVVMAVSAAIAAAERWREPRSPDA